MTCPTRRDDPGTAQEREKNVFAWCRAADLPVGFVLAGGYTDSGSAEDELVHLHRLTLGAAPFKREPL